MIRASFFMASAALVLLGCESEGVEATVVHGSAVDHGRALFSDPGASPSTLNAFACATCHRAESDATDSRILPGAVLAGVTLRSSFWAGAENDLLRAVNACRTYFMVAQEPWTTEDEEAKAMYAFLVALPPQAPKAQGFTWEPAAYDLPAGDVTRGGDVYARSCLSCHGAVHTGQGRLTERAPILPEDSIAYFESIGFDATERRIVFVEKVRHGGFFGLFGSMPLYASEVLSDEELSDALAFMGMYP
jgi:thiosulfate dehydrogenase